MRWLATALLFFMLASPVEARDYLADIPLMMERIVAITGLPMAPPPRIFKNVPLRLIFLITGKSYARAVYLPGLNYIYYAPGHKDLIPHELVHVLQKAAGLIPSTPNNERHAARIGREYWKRWPN